MNTSSLALLADGLTQTCIYWDNLAIYTTWIIVPLPAMDHYITHTQTRSANDMSDTTIRETTAGKAKTEYNGDSVRTSTDLEDFPDGGLRAWLIIGRTMCTSFATIGFVNAWGVPSTVHHCSIIVGHIFDFGYFRVPFILGTILLVISTFLIAECSQYWHFLLCQGFASRVSSGIDSDDDEGSPWV
ncbi:hypothetical protein ARMSODRAFT_972646 [Armillaria solidipes]|uniref:Uncharacterized protein n=1 Tax=Armillaria solidipes TaxID=1076256 RepID=A0A2H3BU64_9AGAR|nr:hypothetical protein ARMSODRAFT_972646 [Armillaria solidipes]